VVFRSKACSLTGAYEYEYKYTYEYEHEYEYKYEYEYEYKYEYEYEHEYEYDSDQALALTASIGGANIAIGGVIPRDRIGVVGVFAKSESDLENAKSWYSFLIRRVRLAAENGRRRFGDRFRGSKLSQSDGNGGTHDVGKKARSQ
jgi:hypothetical protein